MVTERLVTRTDRLVERDPETNLMKGAAPFTLGPEDAGGAVLFVHGFIGAPSNFADLPERLGEQGWRVRVMLLPGHGTSPRDLVEVPPEQMVDAVLKEFDALQAQHGHVALVGHSMGGSISTIVASRRDVDALVLIAPYFGVTHRWYYILKPETWIKVGSPVVPWVYKGNLFVQVNRPEGKREVFSYRWTPTRALVHLAALATTANLPEVLEKVTCPVLLIHSTGDVAASWTAAERAVGRMASETKAVTRFTASNHHILFDYDREEAKEAVLEFLGSPQQTTPAD